MKRYRYVILKQDKPNALLPYGVEVYLNQDKEPIKTYWFKTPQDRLEGLTIVANYD